MRLALFLAAAAFLTGCHAIPIGVLYAVEGIAAGTTIARNVVGIDTSISQTHPVPATAPAQ